MNSAIDPDDKIWNIFLGYANLVSSEANKLGMDIYGTEQRTNIATSLTVSHMLDRTVNQLKDLQKQQATINKNIKNSSDA
jgi:hypothetical protein